MDKGAVTECLAGLFPFRLLFSLAWSWWALPEPCLYMLMLAHMHAPARQLIELLLCAAAC